MFPRRIQQDENEQAETTQETKNIPINVQLTTKTPPPRTSIDVVWLKGVSAILIG
jgi:hypothetical protein